MTSLNIGTTSDGEGFKPPFESLTTMIAIIGRRGSGKTTTALVFAEEEISAGLPVVLLDPLGVHWGLRSSADGEKPGLPVTILGGAHGDLTLEEKAGALIADLVVEQPGAYIVDFSGFESRSAEKRFATDFAERLYRAKAHETSALQLIVDEADTFAPQNAQGDDKRMLGSFEAIARRGRVRGLGMVAITQRPAVLNKNVLSQCELVIAHQLTAPQDRDALKAWAVGNSTPDQLEAFLDSLASLKVGEAWVWSPAWLEIFERVQVRPRRTFDSSRTPKAGEQRVEPRVLAAVDLAALRDRMAAAIEQADANDPKRLRERIKALEEQLKTGSRSWSSVEVAKKEPVPCNHEALIAELRQDLADSQGYVKQLMVERGQRDVIIEQYEQRSLEVRDAWSSLAAVKEMKHYPNRKEETDGPRQETNGARAVAVEDRTAAPPDDLPPARPRSGEPQPRRERSPQSTGGAGGPQRPAPTKATKRIEDMTEDEAREFMREEIARQLKDSDRVLYVPSVEVLRKDYLQRAVDRAIEKAAQVGPDGREVLRFMLAHFDDPMVVSMPISRIAAGVSDYREGRPPERWNNVLRALATAGLVEISGRGGSQAYRPRVREWVQSELRAHDATIEEIETTYQAVLAELAGEVVAA